MVPGLVLERADIMVRLRLCRVADRASAPGWITVLRSAGAQDTYLRTYRGALDAGRVVQFLLRDTLFPRSVFHALRQAEECLQRLGPGGGARTNAEAAAARGAGRGRRRLG